MTEPEEQLSNWISKLDERSLNTWKTTERIEKHLELLNGSIADAIKQVASDKASISALWKVLIAIIGVLGVANVLVNALT